MIVRRDVKRLGRSTNVVETFCDYLGALDANEWRTVTAGGGAATAGVTAVGVGTVGIATLTLDASGESAFAGSARTEVWDFTYGPIEYEARVMLDVLSDGTDTMAMRHGLIDSTSGNAADGYYFYYTHSDNSGKWQVIIRRASSTVGTLNTIVPVVADQWYRLELRVESNTGRVTAFIDGAYCGSVVPSTLIETSRLTGHGSNANKSAGESQHIVHIDYHRVRQRVQR